MDRVTKAATVAAATTAAAAALTEFQVYFLNHEAKILSHLDSTLMGTDRRFPFVGHIRLFHGRE